MFLQDLLAELNVIYIKSRVRSAVELLVQMLLAKLEILQRYIS